MSRLVRDVIKHQNVVAMAKEATVAEASREMAKKRIGAIVVVENGKLAGIFTERDGLFRVLAEGRDPNTTLLAEVMTAKLMTIGPEKTLLNALHIMHENSFRHLPVVVNDAPVGMLSIRDALDYELVHFLEDIEQKEALAAVL